MTNSLHVAVVGGGNGGQAMAGHLAMGGHDVLLCSRDADKLRAIDQKGGIRLVGEVEGFGRIHKFATGINEAISDAEIIMVTATADAHRSLAIQMAPFLRSGQIVVLNPGRTGGAIDFRRALQQNGGPVDVVVLETQSLIYACRTESVGIVRVLGLKERVLTAALPNSDTKRALERLRLLYPCLMPAESVLTTSLENIGAILHCPIMLFNAAAIERGDRFKFYHNITPQVARFIVGLDQERLRLGAAYGVELHSAEEWVSYAYDSPYGGDLFNRIKSNPAYYAIEAPSQIRSRMLLEDIPTGILPMLELGQAAGLELKLMKSVLLMAEALLEEDFRAQGRTLTNLGLEGLSVNEIKDHVIYA